MVVVTSVKRLLPWWKTKLLDSFDLVTLVLDLHLDTDQSIIRHATTWQACDRAELSQEPLRCHCVVKCRSSSADVEQRSAHPKFERREETLERLDTVFYELGVRRGEKLIAANLERTQTGAFGGLRKHDVQSLPGCV
jgi:predicted deacylase